MIVKNVYNKIFKQRQLWNYYNDKLIVSNIYDENECYRFITEYIRYSEKSKSVLFEGIDYLKNNDSHRLTHIVSTFFLGIYLFRNKPKFIHNSVMKELRKLSCFSEADNEELEQQFTFVWFMATLFHDLGYKYETQKNGEPLPSHVIPEHDALGRPFVESVPMYYKKHFRKYYEYRENKEHGICAGLIYDKDLCEIRRFQETKDSQLNWKEELEELYHYVAWIILSHNIWMIRDDKADAKEYRDNSLEGLILSSKKDKNDQYSMFNFGFRDYPLFTLFCIIDTIEPTKASVCLSDIKIEVKQGKLIVISSDADYRKKIADLGNWLCPVTVEGEKVSIYLT